MSQPRTNGHDRMQARWAFAFVVPSMATLLAAATARGDLRVALLCIGGGALIAGLLLLVGHRWGDRTKTGREVLRSFYRWPIIGPFARFGNYVNKRVFGFDVKDSFEPKGSESGRSDD